MLMRDSKKHGINRRGFLKGAAVGAAGLVSKSPELKAQQAQQAQAGRGAAAAPSARALAAETEPVSTDAEVLTADHPGSDFMLDVIKSLGIEYIAANPGSSFRALHESIINYGGNKSPELLTCCHEESSIFIADGYARVEGKPMGVMAHSTVGLQHAAMGIYNSFAARVPVFILLGNTIDVAARRPGVEWYHSAQDAAAMVRDYTKWDDLPISLTHFAESAVRAYKIAMTPPMMPILLVADSDLQERPVPANAALRIPKLTLAAPPQGDSAAVAEAARLLVAAEDPVIDQASRMNFPTMHPFNHSARGRELVSGADVILGLEVTDFWGAVHSYRDQLERSSQSIIDEKTKLISITANDLYVKGNYQDFQRYPELNLAIAADAEATLPSLIDAVRRALNSDRKRTLEDRGRRLAETHGELLQEVRSDAAYAWDASPISTA